VFYNLGNFIRLSQTARRSHFQAKPLAKYASGATSSSIRAADAYPEGGQTTSRQLGCGGEACTIPGKGSSGRLCSCRRCPVTDFPAAGIVGRNVCTSWPEPVSSGMALFEGTVEDERRLF